MGRVYSIDFRVVDIKSVAHRERINFESHGKDLLNLFDRAKPKCKQWRICYIGHSKCDSDGFGSDFFRASSFRIIFKAAWKWSKLQCNRRLCRKCSDANSTVLMMIHIVEKFPTCLIKQLNSILMHISPREIYTCKSTVRRLINGKYLAKEDLLIE